MIDSSDSELSDEYSGCNEFPLTITSTGAISAVMAITDVTPKTGSLPWSSEPTSPLTSRARTCSPAIPETSPGPSETVAVVLSEIIKASEGLIPTTEPQAETPRVTPGSRMATQTTCPKPDQGATPPAVVDDASSESPDRGRGRMRGQPPAAPPTPKKPRVAESDDDYLTPSDGDAGSEDDSSNSSGLSPKHSDGEGDEGNLSLTRRPQGPKPQQWKKHVNRDERRREKQKLKPKPVDCSNCHLRCNAKITEDQRAAICREFRSSGDYRRKHDYVAGLIESSEVQRQRSRGIGKPKSKSETRNYFLPSPDGSRMRVCARFFMATLRISNSFIQNTRNNTSTAGHSYGGSDQRGRHFPKHKASPALINDIKAHIDSFPRVESHYCRQSSQKEYLESGLDIASMHRLYTELFVPTDDCPKAASYWLYGKNFGDNFNISFFSPKKDQCEKCNLLHELKGRGADGADEAARYETDAITPHLRNKEIARKMKADDKEAAQTDQSIHAITFDLQAVLHTPHSDVSLFYYKRKLSVYNFTIWSLAKSHMPACFMWPENEGQRGAAEIGSCLFDYIKALPSTVKHVIAYSDACGGQNRNRMVTAALLFAVRSLPIETIEQKFLESGHTQMECDNMHSRIEKVRKNQQIYCAPQWATLISGASRSDPYSVRQMSHSDFYDLDALQKQILRNPQMLQLSAAKVLKMDADHPTSVFVKYEYEGEFQEIIVREARGSNFDPQLCPLYDSELPIDEKKKTDLMELLSRGAVPRQFRGFYEDLKTK